MPNPVLFELQALESLIAQGASHVQRHHLCDITVAAERVPVLAVTMGNPSLDVPVVGFFGGVHGLERIGAEVVMAYLASLVSRLRWDSTLHRMLESTRIVFMPLVNPGGLMRGTRANPQGIDLMRNARGFEHAVQGAVPAQARHQAGQVGHHHLSADTFQPMHAAEKTDHRHIQTRVAHRHRKHGHTLGCHRDVAQMVPLHMG